MILPMTTIFPVFLIILAIFLLSGAVAGLSFAPWVPLWTKDLERVFRLANIQQGEVFYDLGCGNGKTVFYAAQKHGAVARGVELSLPLYVWCIVRSWMQPSLSVQFYFGNLFKTSVHDADVIYVFGLSRQLQDKLRPKLERELRSGARVISYSFPITVWTPSQIDKPTAKHIAIYLYER